MFELIKSGTSFDFVGKFKVTSALSMALVIGSLVLLFTGLKYGVDFRGGAEVQVRFTEKVELKDLRSTLKSENFSGVNVLSIGAAEDNEFLVKLQGSEKNLNPLTEKLNQVLKSKYSAQGAKIRKVDIVGPKAGAELRKSGFQAMGWALIVIMVYIGLRFDFKYSPGAIAALFHDVMIILGVFSLTGTEFTLQTVAALLAVIGYSVNDTVIVYDRVREQEQKAKDKTLAFHINTAINETLSRTVLTSGTTLFVSLTMFFFGGAAIRDFFLAISLGVLIGTYSSIFVAAPVTLFFDRMSEANKKKSSSSTGSQNLKENPST